MATLPETVTHDVVFIQEHRASEADMLRYNSAKGGPTDAIPRQRQRTPIRMRAAEAEAWPSPPRDILRYALSHALKQAHVSLLALSGTLL